MLCFLFPSGSEIVVILVIALLVFGPQKLPEIGRQIGSAMRELRKMTGDVQRAFDLDDYRYDNPYSPSDYRAPESSTSAYIPEPSVISESDTASGEGAQHAIAYQPPTDAVAWSAPQNLSADADNYVQGPSVTAPEPPGPPNRVRETNPSLSDV